MIFRTQVKGFTLLEVMVAMVILAIAILPIFGVMTQDLKETDVQVAQTFALDRARMVLSTILDGLPFSDLLPGNPAILQGGSIDSAKILFPGCVTVAGGRACLGIASDSRGVHYQVYLRADPIEDTTSAITAGELTFSVYKNPRVERQANWQTIAVNAATTQENTNNQPSILRKTTGLVSPYRFFGVAGITQDFWGPEEEALNGEKKFDQRLITKPGGDGKFRLIVRLILEMSWNISREFYSDPTAGYGRPQKLRVVTYKAKLDD